MSTFAPGRSRFILAIAAAVSAAALTATSQADVFNMPVGSTNLQFVTVSDAGNVGDTRVNTDSTSGYGAVPYNYNISKFDVTVAQYTQFLNAVAKTDQFQLWNTWMDPSSPFPAGITRIGSVGNYAYSFTAGVGNRPMTSMSWGSAARFANWVTNGQPTSGVEIASTTEDGSYLMNGAITDTTTNAVVRKPNAKFAIPTENEWYKAAYYKGGSTNAGYWRYATQTDVAPSPLLPPGVVNSANFNNITAQTDVGAYINSPSHYGTFDQNGNVWQYNETVMNATQRGLRGGSFFDPAVNNVLAADFRNPGWNSSQPAYALGFRLVEVPEPTSCAILACGTLVLLARRRKG